MSEHDANRDLLIGEIARYLETDLVCHRADTPAALRERQQMVWAPYLSWFENEFGAVLNVAAGIIAVAQPEAAAASVKAALKDQPLEIVQALKTATSIAGSAVLSLALWRGAFPAEQIFEASRVDERFQEEQWGEDAEAKARENMMRDEFMKAAALLRRAGPGD